MICDKIEGGNFWSLIEMEINPTEVNQRLTQNEVFCHRKLATPIKQLLSITPDQLNSIPMSLNVANGWLINGTEVIDELTDFRGVIDLETTGLAYDDKVLCAVGIGFIGDEFVYAVHGKCDKLPIQYSVVFNVNQPFDRSFYYIENGKDTNLHVDISSMAKMIHGTPKPNKFGFHSYISLNNLSEYYLGVSVDKSDRELLVAGNLGYQETIDYCLRDVIATVKVSQKVIPDYVKKNPSPISLYGLAARSFSIPMSDELPAYIEKIDKWYSEQLLLLQDQLELAAINALTDPELDYFFNTYHEDYKTDSGVIKAISGIGSNLANRIREELSASNPRARNIKIVKICKGEITFSSSCVALIVKARYQGELLKYSRRFKIWTYGNNELPNTENPDASLLTPFSKGYFEDEQLTSDVSDVRSILGQIQMWISFQSRLREIKLDRFGYHHPRYTPCHTLTGRSVDKVFLLAPKPSPKKGGSEFLKLIQAKPGYQIVTADFDSAELIYAAHIANYYLGNDDQMGCDFARVILEGDSDLKTDIHSLVSQFLEVDRGTAKNLDYGANYGQGNEKRIQAIMKSTGKSRSECEKLNQQFKAFYIEGKADPFFTGMKEIAKFGLPTALLMAELPDGLKDSREDEYYTTKNNRVIQALGTDHLNLLITDVQRQIEEYRLDATLILTRHDEVLFEVAENQTEVISDVLQSAHKFSVMCLLARLGIRIAVDKWLKFSSVDVMPRYQHSGKISPTELI